MPRVFTQLPEVVEQYAAKVQWVDGRPVVIGTPMTDGPVDQKLKDLLHEAMKLPYDGSDPRYVGLTKGEAIIIDLVDQASLGDPTARREVLDRSLGKPLQNIKSVSIKGSIEDFLDGLSPIEEPIDVTSQNEAEEI